jgi:polyisoprenoid-binding protein YceI
MSPTLTPPRTRELDEAPPPAKKRAWWRWLAGGFAVAVLVVIGGPFVYIHFVEGPAPAPLSLPLATSASASTGVAQAPLAGTWTVAPGSIAGYRVKEKLFGQPATAVGRTNRVTGSMTIAGTRVTNATYTVDLTSVSSDRPARDSQFRGRIMGTAEYPTATFVLTKPIELAPIPGDGVVAHYSAAGKLTLHGTTRSVAVPLQAERSADRVAVQGILGIRFADYGVANPSLGPARVGGSGQLEFVLHFSRKETS